MTEVRTQHVIDAIDGALEDWSVSGDAMRWSPETPSKLLPRPLPGSHIRCTVEPVFGSPTLTNAEFVQAYREIATRACAEIGRAFTRFAEHLAPAMQHLGELGIVPKPPPADPRARALALRQARNTGPARPTASQAKRPRQHW